MKKLVIFFLAVLCLNGCAWLSLKRTSPSEATISLRSAKILDNDRFKQGKTISMVPFTAGTNVVSDQDVNRSALMIVKGFTEVLKDQDSELSVVFQDRARETDFLITGRITAVSRTPFIKRLMRKPDILHMEIDAKMIDPATDKLIAVFQNKRDSQNKRQTLPELGYLIGQDIGKYLDTENRIGVAE